MYADDLLRPWYDAVVPLVPGFAPFDAHTHIGQDDPDGYRLGVEDLLAALETVGGRAAVFPMHEPAGYPPANDRVLREAGRSDGRLVAYCRLDPHTPGAAAEAERCLDAGARGIKLHPRAERFRLEEPLTEPIWRVANERRVPVIVHAGRGIPALGRDALVLAARFPEAPIILAHAAVCDLGWIWRHAADQPNLYFDTAWWNAVDLLALMSLVPPGQILYGSDMPYGTPVHSAILTFRCAIQAGVGGEALGAIAGRQLERLLDGGEPLALGPPAGTVTMARDVLLERVSSYLQTAIGRMLVREDAREYVALARLACEVGDDAPQAPVCRSVLALLDRFEHYVAASAEFRNADGEQRFPGLHLVIAAAAVALTPDVALPPDPEPVAAGERSA